ncbi:FkbM family methyltransferase [Microcoleus sp. D2_18a_D3]|uniref:FkbM family methyltransferase n=1 Tax=Microcoleus sp. D2_18a_D3 TaxID=3055330 RepID=UPI002FD34A2C
MTAIFRTIYWAVLCQLRIPATVEIPKWKCRFFLPAKFKQAGSTGIFVLREDYEPELYYLERSLSPGSVFVDAGANTGIYTVLAAKLVGDVGKVLSFEPGEESYQNLDRNVKLNNLTQVKLFKSALSDTEGTAKFYHIDNAPNSYSLGGDGSENTTYEEVATTTIDSVLNREGIEGVDFIKMDVEGAEEYVLQGAKSLFSKMRPTVLFEINEKAIDRFKLSDAGAWNFLKNLGYEFFTVKDTGELQSVSAPQEGNILAIPKA